MITFKIIQKFGVLSMRIDFTEFAYCIVQRYNEL